MMLTKVVQVAIDTIDINSINSSAADLKCEIIMDDGKKLMNLVFNKGFFTKNSHNKAEEEYRDAQTISNALRIYSYEYRLQKILKEKLETGILKVIDVGKSDSLVDIMGIVKKEFRLYDNKVVMKTNLPIYGNKYTDIKKDDISMIEIYNGGMRIHSKYRDEPYKGNFKLDFDVIKYLIEQWAISNTVKFKSF
jgi:hypothetical protein